MIIIHPLQLLRTADLDFGRITPLAGGTATVAAGGGLSVTGVVAAGGTPHPAAFTGAAQRASIVYIQYPPPTVLNRVGGGASLTVNAFTLQSSNAIATLPGGTLLLATGAGAFTFTLGGTITVAAGQADGIYVANLDVIANYF